MCFHYISNLIASNFIYIWFFPIFYFVYKLILMKLRILNCIELYFYVVYTSRQKCAEHWKHKIRKQNSKLKDGIGRRWVAL